MKPGAGMRKGAVQPASQPPAAEGAAAASGAASPATADPWADAQLAALLLAVHPHGLGGVRLRGGPGPARDAWLQLARAAFPPGTPWQRLPLHTDDERLLGGLDLGATLQRGTVVLQPGLLQRCDGGVLLVPMAERMSPSLATKLAAVLDSGSVALQRAGTMACAPARLAVLALDEAEAADAGSAAAGDTEAPPQALLDRVAFNIDLKPLRMPIALAGLVSDGPTAAAAPQAEALAVEVAAARQRLHRVQCSEELLQALCEAAMALGVAGLRASLFALAAARAHAAWCGRVDVELEDAAAAARLVLAPLATRLPAAAEPSAPPPEPTDEAAGEDEPPLEPPAEPAADAAPPPEAAETEEKQDPDEKAPVEASVQDQVLQAARAAIPPGLLELLAGAAARAPAGAGGRAGALQRSRLRGRPYGSVRGDPRTGARLHLIDTLRAAAPWQLLRRREQPAGPGAAPGPAVLVRREDFHISRFRQRRETTTLFIVDASGSAALHRLAEAKGAVELLLADCYVRRDRVALLAFRGAVGAELLLPPTRSLVRAKRSLAALAGGGGTPLAAALDHAHALMQGIARKGGTPLAVLLTDGRANIARDGSPGRERAHADAMAAARQWQASGLGALWLDTAPQPQPLAQHIAQAMGARYLPLPMADARQVSRAVTALR